MDLAIIGATTDEMTTGASALRLLFNAGGGTFQTAASYPLMDAGSLTAGELNGDGLPDLAVLGPGSAVSVFFSTCK